MKYYGIDLFFSGYCNFKCKYCVISKCPDKMAKYNQELRESLKDGSFAEKVIDTVGYKKNDITDISFWGMEPTINADLFSRIFVPLFCFFDKTETTMFSTNSSLGIEPILEILNCIKDFCDSTKRKIRLSLQFSLDGPPWINDYSRNSGATLKTIETMEKVVQADLESKYFTLVVDNKATLDDYFIKQLNQKPDSIRKYFQFFDDLMLHLKSLNKNSNLFFGMPAKPTFVLPGEHTQEDGKELAKFIRNLKSTDISGLVTYTHPLIEQPMRFINGNIFSNNIFSNLNGRYCCAGYGTICIDKDGNRFDCHTLYEKVVTKEELDFCKDYMNLNSKDDKKQRLMFENQKLLRNFPDAHFHMTESIIIALASAGQIDPIYLHNQAARKILFLLILNSLCHEICALETGNIYVPNTSIIKYLGNGAAQELLDYYSYEWSNI